MLHINQNPTTKNEDKDIILSEDVNSFADMNLDENSLEDTIDLLDAIESKPFQSAFLSSIELVGYSLMKDSFSGEVILITPSYHVMVDISLPDKILEHLPPLEDYQKEALFNLIEILSN
jgi:hypothetical protein